MFSTEKFSHFLKLHYVVNILLCVVFYFLKIVEPLCSSLFDDCHLELREWELMTFLGCIIVLKNRKTPSFAMYFQTVCMFGKLMNFILFARQNYFYGVAYAVACLLHLIFLPEPVYRGPEYITYFRGPNLQHELERDKRVMWLVEFYAPWAPNCVRFASEFSELSAQFTLDNLKFGKVDVTRSPDIAKKFNIDTSSWSKQLPTVILFQGGKETRRRPAIDSKGKVLAKFVFCKENILRDFELAELYNQCKKNPISKKKPANGADNDAQDVAHQKSE